MLFFFALASAFNLCVGYVLGAYIGVLPGVRRRPESGAGISSDWAISEDEPPFALGDPEPYLPPAEGPTQITAEYGDTTTAGGELTAEFPNELILSDSSERSSAASDIDEGDLRAENQTPMCRESAESAWQTPNASMNRNLRNDQLFDLDDYVALLASFRHDLVQIDEQLRRASDEVAVEHCAAEMTTANNRYVVQSKQACERLEQRDEDSPALSEEKLQFRHSISSQARQVMNVSEEIRGIDMRTDPQAAKSSLLEVTSELSRAATQLQQELKDIFERAESGIESGAERIAADETGDERTGEFDIKQPASFLPIG